MHRLLARSAAVVASTALAVCAAGSPAWAPKYIFGSLAYGDCLRGGSEPERFEGTLTVTSFSRSASSLLATGLLSGACLTDAGAVTAVLPEHVATFVVGSVEAFCTDPDVGVMVRPGVQVSGRDAKTGAPAPFLVDLSRGTVVERSWTPGDPMSERGKICALDRIADRRPLPALAPVLNGLVRA